MVDGLGFGLQGKQGPVHGSTTGKGTAGKGEAAVEKARAHIAVARRQMVNTLKLNMLPKYELATYLVTSHGCVVSS